MTVTSTDGPLITGLAGRSATAVMHDVIHALPREQQAIAQDGLHLGIALDEYVDAHGPGGFVVRAVEIARGHHQGALQVDGAVRPGQTVRFHLRDPVAAHEELQIKLDRHRESTGSSVAGALAISDVGRGGDFFESRDHDITVIGERLGDAAVAGLVSQGQIAPAGGRSRLHTLATTLLIFPTSTQLADPMRQGPQS
jgi:small ligand-binding sensory domain FIST